MSDVFAEAKKRYEDACQRRQETIEAWEAENKPLTTIGSRDQVVDHPLVKQINELDKLCAALGQALERKHRGPDPRAVVHAGVGQSPAVRVRKRGGLKAV